MENPEHHLCKSLLEFAWSMNGCNLSSEMPMSTQIQSFCSFGCVGFNQETLVRALLSFDDIAILT